MTRTAWLSPRQATAVAPDIKWCLLQFWALDAVVASRSERVCTRVAMVSPESGDTTACLGQEKMSFLDRHVTAGNAVAWRRGSPAPDWVWIMRTGRANR